MPADFTSDWGFGRCGRSDSPASCQYHLAHCKALTGTLPRASCPPAHRTRRSGMLWPHDQFLAGARAARRGGGSMRSVTRSLGTVLIVVAAVSMPTTLGVRAAAIAGGP